MYIHSKGDIIINVYIDGQEVYTNSFTTEGTHVLQIPQSKQRGYYIQFEVSGSGIVSEIEYRAGRRTDG